MSEEYRALDCEKRLQQELKVLQYASNGDSWEPWIALLDKCDNEPASVNPRLLVQQLYKMQ
ncbi:unnamed protein product [Choristocarpus tenellus]